jgi:hypothetical protein
LITKTYFSSSDKISLLALKLVKNGGACVFSTMSIKFPPLSQNLNKGKKNNGKSKI